MDRKTEEKEKKIDTQSLFLSCSLPESINQSINQSSEYFFAPNEFVDWQMP